MIVHILASYHRAEDEFTTVPNNVVHRGIVGIVLRSPSHEIHQFKFTSRTIGCYYSIISILIDTPPHRIQAKSNLALFHRQILGSMRIADSAKSWILSKVYPPVRITAGALRKNDTNQFRAAGTPFKVSFGSKYPLLHAGGFLINLSNSLGGIFIYLPVHNEYMAIPKRAILDYTENKLMQFPRASTNERSHGRAQLNARSYHIVPLNPGLRRMNPLHRSYGGVDNGMLGTNFIEVCFATLFVRSPASSKHCCASSSRPR